MGPFEVMLMTCIGAFFGGILKDIVMDFAQQDKALKLLDIMSEDVYEFDEIVEKSVLPS